MLIIICVQINSPIFLIFKILVIVHSDLQPLCLHKEGLHEDIKGIIDLFVSRLTPTVGVMESNLV